MAAAARALLWALFVCLAWAAPAPAQDAPAKGPFLFEDRARQLGLDFRHSHGGQGRKYLVETMGGGGAFLDFDNDGWPDVYLVQSGGHDPERRSGNRLFRNEAGAEFRPVGNSGAEDRGYGMGCAVGDYDNDGFPDIYVTNFGANALLRNKGDGTFEDVTAKAGVDDPRWSVSAAFADVDLDGDLDLYVANYLDFSYEKHIECGDEADPSYCHPDVYPAAPNSFYLNQGDGTFQEAASKVGLSPGEPQASKSLGAAFFDMDLDGDLDLYVANDSTANYLFENLGPGRFEDVSDFSGTAFNIHGKTEAGMGIAVGDIQRNGRFDLVVTHMDFETNTVYVNQGDGFFSDQSDRTGLGGPSRGLVGFGTHLEDFDNDGWLDLFVANGHVIDNIARENPSLSHAQPNQIFRNLGGGRFVNASAESGPYFSRPNVSRGSAVADYDLDGDLDILVVNNDGAANLLENRSRPANWVRFELRGRDCNRDGVGARLHLESGDLKLAAGLHGGTSYASQSHLQVHFGLGDRSRIDKVLVLWPCGKRQVLENPPANIVHELDEPGD